MIEISEPTKLKESLTKVRNKSIGFVPTMGALHKGHMSLIKQSVHESDITVVSVFVNPTQFNDKNDLDNYPVDLSADKKILEENNVDYLFTPKFETIYKDEYNYKIVELKLSKILCGKTREGHFDGVLTIVMKLLNIVNADRAYFGEKDFQQFLLVKDMAETFFLDTKIISVPTVREKDGLALSSRNVRLKSEDRKKAPLLYEALKSDLTDEEIIYRLEQNAFKVDYIESINGRRYGAVFLGNVRLIDNVKK